MTSKCEKSFFVSGTDTGIGKTFTCAHLSRYFISKALKVAFYKPIETGLESNIKSDIEFLKSYAPEITVKRTYSFGLPATPELAASKENKIIDLEKILKDFHELKETHDLTIVEGAGGLFVPIKNNLTIGNLIQELKLPLLLVSANKLGTINHTCLSLHYAQTLKLNTLGFCFSSCEEAQNDIHKTNAKFIEKYTGVKSLGSVPRITKESDPSISSLAISLDAILFPSIAKQATNNRSVSSVPRAERGEPRKQNEISY